MEIKVESYFTEEADLEGVLSPEATEQIKQKANELGLEGQIKVFEKEGVIPFHRLSEGELRIWKIYCPQGIKLKEYSDGVIPLRVMEVIGIAYTKNYFDDIFVWTEFEKDPDPILVGIKDKAIYLIARWGLALKSWEEIVKLAKEKWITKARASLIDNKEEAIARLAKIESLVEDWVSGKWVPIYL